MEGMSYSMERLIVKETVEYYVQRSSMVLASRLNGGENQIHIQLMAPIGVNFLHLVHMNSLLQPVLAILQIYT